MHYQTLGQAGPRISTIGLGAMSFAGAFGATDLETSLECLDAAYASGINFIDTANIYGMGRSEEVIATWLRTRKADVVIASKCGIQRNSDRPVNNDPAYIRQELEGSLRRLGVERIDLYYLHRVDPNVPLEASIGTMAELQAEGKIGGYGLSEAAPYTVRRAHDIAPCTAVQNEYSLWTRLPELGLIQTCRALGITFVPFSPLARGVLTDRYPDVTQMAETDFRRGLPRFQPDNYRRNLAMVDEFRQLAAQMEVTTSALAMAWVLSRGAHLVPIPGTRTASHVQDWVTADQIKLSAADLDEIERCLPVGIAYGDRYSDALSRTPERYC